METERQYQMVVTVECEDCGKIVKWKSDPFSFDYEGKIDVEGDSPCPNCGCETFLSKSIGAESVNAFPKPNEV